VFSIRFSLSKKLSMIMNAATGSDREWSVTQTPNPSTDASQWQPPRSKKKQKSLSGGLQRKGIKQRQIYGRMRTFD